MEEFSGFSAVPRLSPATASPVRGLLLTETVCCKGRLNSDFINLLGRSVQGPYCPL
jgi:hypothetical protein